jgi:geranylgeranyl pyrophosphate synthase
VAIAKNKDDGVPPAGKDLAWALLLQDFVRRHGLVPPMTLKHLSKHVGDFIQEKGCDERYRDWLMVMLNNALWTETLASIPHQRRLLLLPECLKNSQTCPAERDSFGLLCDGCGGCCLGGLLDEADALGMMTLVAEGSTMVADLLKSGDVEAVVGVSCLDALGKAFPEMIAAAVPGMAIPLSKSGCRDTEVNLALVRQAIALPYKPGPTRLNPALLKQCVEQWFNRDQLGTIVGEATSVVERLGYDWIAGNGKRWRPYLTAALAEAVTGGGENLSADVKKLAVAVECFHKATLIHDDIEDEDLERDGEPSLHARIGLGPALNIGDFLIGEGYRMVGETEQEAAVKGCLFQAAFTAHRQLTIGQGLELEWMRQPAPLTREQALEIFSLKTAPAFEVALAFGAIATGIYADLQQLIHEFSEALGIAYQISDDIADFSAEHLDAAPSIILACLCAARPGASIADLRELAEKGDLDAEVAEARASAQTLYQTYRDLAFDCLSELKLPELKLVLFRIAGKILK